MTFTCKPTWRDIKDAIAEHHSAIVRYDIANRVFHLKFKKNDASFRKRKDI